VFDEAIKVLEEMERRLELGRALDRRGRFHLAGGDRERALSDLKRAREIFAAAGARRDQARADEVLRA
jgi:hypothetical protein